MTMKKIIAPTDFSAPAANAVDYAAGFARKVNADLVLIHCFHLPVMTTGENVVPIVTADELEKESKEAIEQERLRVMAKYPGLNVTAKSCMGFAVDEILHCTKDIQPDLIIMGITGAGRLGELMGSTATSVAKHAECPVLIIPEDARFEELERIAMACDLKVMPNKGSFDIVRELAKHFGSGVDIFTVMKPGEEITVEKAANGIQIEHSLEDVKHTMHFTEGNDVVEGIEKFVKNNRINMVTMVTRRHKFIDRLLHESKTKRMAFHTHVPLLAIHE
jgi:nucleotide-binding universal stress UspA family protein